MKFVFPDCNEYEADVITNFLAQDNIPFKTYQRKVPIYIEFEDEEPYDYVNIYDITCNTDLAHYDFVKNITNKKIKTVKELNTIFYTKKEEKTKGKKHVSTRKKTSD